MLKAYSIRPTAFSLAVLSIALFYWIGNRVISPRTTINEAAVFLQRGDSDYLPQVSALSRLEFGESVVREMAHRGVRSFPIASLLLHAAMVRLLGDPGFAFAHLLVILLHGCALSCFLQMGGISRRVAEILTLVVISQAANQVIDFLSSFTLSRIEMEPPSLHNRRHWFAFPV